MRINKGDKVRVIYGSFRGREGVVEKVYAAKGLVLISGVNLVKKHLKGSGIIQIGKALAASKVGLVCPKCQKVTRVLLKSENGRKVRHCLKCQSVL